MDYLKKELEWDTTFRVQIFKIDFKLLNNKCFRNFNNFKEQYSKKDKLVTELESKLKEFKLIDMIYKGNAGF